MKKISVATISNIRTQTHREISKTTVSIKIKNIVYLKLDDKHITSLLTTDSKKKFFSYLLKK